MALSHKNGVVPVPISSKPLLLMLGCAFALLFSCGSGGADNGQNSSAPTRTMTTPQNSIFFSADFEAGDFSNWDSVWQPQNWSIISAPLPVHGGSKAAQVYYWSGNADPPQRLPEDLNYYLGQNLSQTINQGTDLYVRSYIYLKHPEPGGSIRGQRKLYYLKSPWRCWNNTPCFLVVLTTEAYADTAEIPALRMRWHYYEVQNDAVHTYSKASNLLFSWDRWYGVQVQVHLASPPESSRDYIKIWLDGIDITNSFCGAEPSCMQNIQIRPSTGYNGSTDTFAIVELGRQCDPWDYGHNYVDKHNMSTLSRSGDTVTVTLSADATGHFRNGLEVFLDNADTSFKGICTNLNILSGTQYTCTKSGSSTSGIGGTMQVSCREYRYWDDIKLSTAYVGP